MHLTRVARESEITLERIRKILASGANVVLTTKGIDDLCLKEFVEAGAMAVRRCRKEDLRRIAKATGGQLVSSLANLEGEETFEASYLGTAEEVIQERISDDELILIKGTKVVSSASIVLRGANDYMLDEMERALHDSLSVIKRTLESGAVVPGGGAVESALSIYLENFATTLVCCLVSSVTQEFNIITTIYIGFPRTAGHRRICRCTTVHSENARSQRSQGFYRTCCEAAIVPQRSTKCTRGGSQESTFALRVRLDERGSAGQCVSWCA